MARPREWIPSEKELGTKVKMVKLKVEGQYLAHVGEKRKTSKSYKIDVLVPENYTAAHVKMLTPHALKEKLEDFVGMRTFKVVGKPEATKETVVLKDIYNDYQIKRFAKKRLKRDVAMRQARQRYIDANGTADGFSYDPETDMPRFKEPEDTDGAAEE